MWFCAAKGPRRFGNRRQSLGSCMLAIPLMLLGAAFSARGEQAPKALEEDLFRAKCIGCHAIACNRSGPKLKDVIGRRAGSVPDFTGYSEALKKSRLVWSEKTLDSFLRDPGALVPGTSMTSAGKIASAKERQSLISFVRRADTSLDLCF
jgi:cytochrome c